MRTTSFAILTALLAMASPRALSPDVTEAGSPHFQISNMGAPGTSAGLTYHPKVAYAPSAQRFLVVWSGSHNSDDRSEFEIYGQLIDGAAGGEIGSDRRLSDMGSESIEFDANDPAVAYNSAANEFLVVWSGDDGVDEAFEIHGQRIDAATGNEVGTNDFAISNVGGGGAGFRPAVAFNPHRAEYLVVWSDNAGVQGQIVSSGGTPIGANFTIPDSGRGGSTPDVAYNPVSREYLLAADTRGFDYAAAHLLVLRLDATGSRLGDAVTVAFADPPDCDLCVPSWPAIAHNPTTNEYVIAWTYTAFYPGCMECHVFTQRLAADGVLLGSSVQVSRPETVFVHRQYAGISYNSALSEFLVVWSGTEPSGSGSAASAIYGQRLSADGAKLGTDNLVLRRLDSAYVNRDAAIASAQGSPLSLIVWYGYGDPPSTDTEIRGRLYPLQQPWIVGLGRGGGGMFQSWRLSRNAADQARQLPWAGYNSLNGELHPAAGDIDGDGLDEIVVGLSVGGQGWIVVFDDARLGYPVRRWVQLPWASYNASNGTVWPAVGDIDGDGAAEIVAGLGAGGQGYYAIFDGSATDYAFLAWGRVNWSWYNTTQSGETHPAVVNVDGGSFSEIVVGLGPGGAGWMELVDDAEAGYAHLRWLRVGWGAYVSGPGETFPAAGDVDGDGYDEIVVGLGPNSQGWLQVFDDAFQGLVHKGWLQVNWSDYANTNGETHPAVGDVDGDAAHEIVLGLGEYRGQGGWFEVRDDFAASFRSLGWRNVGRGDFYAAGGATFPAIPHSR